MPKGRAKIVATIAMRSDSATAVHSWGERFSKGGAFSRCRLDQIAETVHLENGLGGGAMQEGEIAPRGFLVLCVGDRRHRISDRRIGAVGEAPDALLFWFVLCVGCVF